LPHTYAFGGAIGGGVLSAVCIIALLLRISRKVHQDEERKKLLQSPYTRHLFGGGTFPEDGASPSSPAPASVQSCPPSRPWCSCCGGQEDEEYGDDFALPPQAHHGSERSAPERKPRGEHEDGDTTALRHLGESELRQMCDRLQRALDMNRIKVVGDILDQLSGADLTEEQLQSSGNP
jgi:hypothetical protein